MDPVFPLWLVVVASIAVGVGAGMLIERAFGSAAKRAARFEADLVQARSDLMQYQQQTKQHFGKSAELLGRMATDYREFLDHFVKGADDLCGPNMKELNASGLERPLLDTPVAADAPPIVSAAMTPTGGLDSEPLAEDAAK
jgi:uncharacterized membrane-anchored protein YhcB (DUF1043 family)